MASKNVLRWAIQKLTLINQSLREKIHKTSNEKERDNYLKEITKNESMILDYKFRLEHDE